MKIKEVFNKFLDLFGNIYFIVIIASMVSFFPYDVPLDNTENIFLVSLLYFIKIKKIPSFINVLIFSAIYTILRFLEATFQIIYNSFPAPTSSEETIFYTIVNFLFAFIVFYFSNIICYFIYKFYKNFIRQKHVLKTIFFVLLFVLLSIHLYQYRFGYFTYLKGVGLNHGKNTSGIYPSFKLNNGNVLFLGLNTIYADTLTSKPKTNYIPTMLYKHKTNKITQINFPKEIYYKPYGILLQNNKILLTSVINPNEFNYNDSKTFIYNSMAIVDLNTLKIEKIMKMKTDKNGNRVVKGFNVLLDNNKIFRISSSEERNKETLIEIYDMDTNTSKIIKEDKLNFWVLGAISTKPRKVLLFGNDKLSDQEFQKIEYGFKDNVYEYDDNTSTIKPVGKVIRRFNSKIIKLSNNKILIIGGELKLPNRTYPRLKVIEMYDTNTNKSEIVSHTIITRCANGELNGAEFGNKYFLIMGGECAPVPIFGIKTEGNPAKQTEVLNLENYDIRLGPKSLFPVSGQQMITLDSKDILIAKSGSRLGYGEHMQIFKVWKRRK